MCRAAETTRAQLKAMTSEGRSEAKVDIVKQRSHSQTFSQDSHAGGRGNRGPHKYTAISSGGKQGPPATQGNIQCNYCGRSQPEKSCPA